MPNIRPSSDLRNKYNEISDYCHKYQKPVFLTRNGVGDLVVMTIAQYEELTAKDELYKEIEKGLKSIEKGKCHTTEEVLKGLEEL